MSARKDPFEVAPGIETPVDSGESTLEFERLSSKPVSPSQVRTTGFSGVVTARFCGFDLNEKPLIVGVPGSPSELTFARTTVPLRQEDVGSTVLVLFEHDDLRCPIVIGVLQDRLTAAAASNSVDRKVCVEADDERLVLCAEREIVLRCGKASITLTRAGKVLIQGEYVSSRSSGVNRIKGGSVQVN